MQREERVIAVGTSAAVLDKALIRRLRGSYWKTDPRFFAIATASLLLHAALLLVLNSVKLKPVEPMVLEKMTDRIAKLIIEKPLPRQGAKESPRQGEKPAPEATVRAPSERTPQTASTTAEGGVRVSPSERKAAAKRVAARVARVEQKMRTVGVLGMLTGMGATAHGPSVVNVLPAAGGKEHLQDLDKALQNMTGVTRATNIDVLSSKLVKSKDVAVTHREDIGDLVASVGGAQTQELAKRGNFVIQKPESIEGAASASAKRDNDAINVVVAAHKAGIRMSYEKFLKRDPALAGKITVRFTIAASGKVSQAEILENTTGNKELEDEIIRKVRMWEFDAITEGDVTVTYPFVFSLS